jgi:hypothetical protein
VLSGEQVLEIRNVSGRLQVRRAIFSKTLSENPVI